MAKDPAFPFYASDFLTGTMYFTDAQTGKYIRLLCNQHQHGGIIDSDIFNNIVGDDMILRKKFIESENGFYNERLADEMIKRTSKSTNISKSAKEAWSKRKGVELPIERKKEYAPIENQIDIWKNEYTFLSDDSVWWQQDILMKIQLPKEEYIKALEQYWLSLQKANWKGDIKMCRAGFKKWLNSWKENLKSKKEDIKTPTKYRELD